MFLALGRDIDYQELVPIFTPKGPTINRRSDSEWIGGMPDRHVHFLHLPIVHGS
jgi:hypothetical protein